MEDPNKRPLEVSTHLDARGQVHMVNVGEKEVTARRAVASAFVRMKASTVTALQSGNTPKGDVLATVRIAGIMAAKRTAELIPLCHSVALTRANIDLEVREHGVAIRATVEATDRTGVEMEALTAASIAALTLYDMLKGIDREMVIEQVALEEKRGGRSGHWVRNQGG